MSLAGLVAPGPRLMSPLYASNAAWRRGVTSATVDGAAITANTHTTTTLDGIARTDGGAAFSAGQVFYIVAQGDIPANTTLTMTSSTAGTLSNAATGTHTGSTYTLEQSIVTITGTTSNGSTAFTGISPPSMINGSVVNITGPGISGVGTLTITSSGGNSGTLGSAAGVGAGSGTFTIYDPYPLGHASRLRAMVQTANTADGNGVIGSNAVNASIVGQMAGASADGGKPLHEAPRAGCQRQPVFFYNTFPSMPSDNLPGVWKSGQTITLGAGNAFYGQAKYWMQITGFLSVPVPLRLSDSVPYNVAYSPKVLDMAGTDHIVCISDRYTNPGGEIWATWKWVTLNINTFTAGQSTWLPNASSHSVTNANGLKVFNVGATTADLAPGSAPSSIACSAGTNVALVDGQYITVGTGTSDAVVFVVNGNVAATSTAIPVHAGQYYAPTGLVTTLPNDIASASSIQMQQCMPPIGYVPPNGDGWYYGFGYGEYLGSSTRLPGNVTMNLPLYPSGSGAQNCTLASTLSTSGQITQLSVQSIPTTYTVGQCLELSDPTVPTSQIFMVSQTANATASPATINVQPDTPNHAYASGTTVVAGDQVGAAACDFPHNAGRITFDDIMRGYIDHALAFESGCGGPMFVIPAHRGDSTGANTANTSVNGTTGSMPAGTYNSTTNPIPVPGGTTRWIAGASNVTIGGVTFTTTSAATPAGSTSILVSSKTTAVDLSSSSITTPDYQYEVPEGGWYRIKPSWTMPPVNTVLSFSGSHGTYPELIGSYFGSTLPNGIAAPGGTVIVDQIHQMIWTAMQKYGFYFTDGTKGTSFIANLQHPTSLDTDWSRTSLAAYNAQVLKIAPNCSFVQTANGQAVRNIGGSGTANKNPAYVGPFALDSSGQPCIQKLVWGSW